VVGVRPEGLVRPVGEADHRLPDHPALQPRPDRIDGPGDVPAEAEPPALPAENAGAHARVDRVERGGGHLDPHLAGTGLGQWNLGDLDGLRAAERADGYGAHEHSSESSGEVCPPCCDRIECYPPSVSRHSRVRRQRGGGPWRP
jgi:hypothetical protein